MKLMFVYIAVLLYGATRLITDFEIQSSAANLLMSINLVVIACLILARFHIYKTEQGSQQVVVMEKEDLHQAALERRAYTAVAYIQIAFSVALISMLAGFMLLRDTEPKIVMASAILMIVSFASFIPSEKIVRVTNPNFKFPNPSSKNYQQEYFDQFDDGEKYVMLKGLYKLYTIGVGGLVFLAICLMYYSVFTDDSQLVSIIGIGALLLLLQIIYTFSLKPKLD